MDSLKKNVLWFSEELPGFARELSGSFVTMLEGVPCQLVLAANQKKLGGSLTLDEQIFDINGFFSRVVTAAYGILLEPLSQTPVALLRITPRRHGVILEIDIPDIDELALTNPRALTFYRICAEVT